MDSVIVALLVVVPLGTFAAGVYFQKYVISEAEAIKQHVSDAETRIREEVSALKSQFDYIKKI
jgi:hypothetical protein